MSHNREVRVLILHPEVVVVHPALHTVAADAQAEVVVVAVAVTATEAEAADAADKRMFIEM